MADPPKNPTTLADAEPVGEPYDDTVATRGGRAGPPLTLGGMPVVRGATLDRFVVLAPLGAGGMGVVVSAYDPVLDRKVAIKILRPDVFSPHATQKGYARLLREAQAMAKLTHPNVITVYEVGTVDDQVFIAMELVDGGTLATWLKQAARPWRDIVDVFTRAGRGLAAAHAAGLVHRDFKPDNVLVGGDGRVRVTDFGLVRVAALPASLASAPGEPAPRDDEGAAGDPGSTPSGALAATLTRTGAVMGTPLYMAPEQHRGLATDARTDQFAFCVALYEALHGERPFAGASAQEVADQVLAGTVRDAPRDAAVPARLRRALLRGLRVEPDERYPSMDALLGELARDPGAGRRRVLAGAAAVLAVAAAGIALGRWPGRAGAPCQGTERKLAGVWDADARAGLPAAFAATGRPYAAAAAAGATAALDDYATAWATMHREACEATRVHGEQSAEALDLRMACLERRRTELGALAALLAHPDGAVVENAVRAAAALPPLAGCADVERLAAPLPPPTDPEVAARVAALRGELADLGARRAAGLFPEALARALPLVEAARATAYKPLEAEALLLLGQLQDDSGDARAAEQSLFAAVLAARASRHGEVEADAAIALVYTIGVGQERHDEGLRWGQMADAVVTQLDDEGVRRGDLLSNLGAVLSRRGSYAEALDHLKDALALRERALGPGHPTVAVTLGNIGGVLRMLARYPEALAHQRRALAIKEAAFGPDHPSVADTLNNLGNTRFVQGENADALLHYRRALAIRERALGADHPDLAASLNNVAMVLSKEPAQRRQRGEARQLYERALALRERALGPDHPEVAASLDNLAVLLSDTGEPDLALAHHQRALAIRERALGADHPDVARSLHNLGVLHRKLGRPAEALVAHRRVLAIRERAFGADHPDVASALYAIGADLEDSGDRAGALGHYQRALAIWEQRLGPDDARVGHTLEAIGLLELARGAPAAAVAPLERALTILAPQSSDAELAELRSALARARKAARPRRR